MSARRPLGQKDEHGERDGREAAEALRQGEQVIGRRSTGVDRFDGGSLRRGSETPHARAATVVATRHTGFGRWLDVVLRHEDAGYDADHRWGGAESTSRPRVRLQSRNA